ncbi:MAG: hypothetical protein R3A10_15125 [Caldilineaceae bacterium]
MPTCAGGVGPVSPRGRSGEISRRQADPRKFIICNADEGDPSVHGRTMIEGDPHRVLEGMLIAARAIGAQTGYIYIRAEYPLAVAALHRGHRPSPDARALWSKNILGSGMDFDFVVKEGAGAFVCGEETALMRSIEGATGACPPCAALPVGPRSVGAIPPTSTTWRPTPASRPFWATGRIGSRA